MCKPHTKLEYNLQPVDGALVLQVTDQSDDITAFLQNNTYRASNGLLIAADEFPEFKDSKNTVFLRGSNHKKDWKLDTTRFVSNTARDSKSSMLQSALKEFVGYVKKLNSYSAPYVYAPYAYAPKYKAEPIKVYVVV
jgi:hypothetical protein